MGGDAKKSLKAEFILIILVLGMIGLDLGKLF